jgi:hypothetical protein
MMRSLKSHQGLLLVSQGVGMALLIGGAAHCSSSTTGNVVDEPDAGDNSSSGASSSGASSSGASSSGASSSGASSSGASSSGASSSGASSSGGDGGACSTDPTETLAVHVKLNVTWGGDTVLVASSGTQVADIWLLSNLTVNGTTITGTSKTCGLKLPDIQTTALVASKKIQLNFGDNSIWDKPSMPTFTVTGTQSGFAAGSTITVAPTVGLLGIASTSSLANPSTAWPPPNAAMPGPTTYPLVLAADTKDDDGDGKPGITIDSNGTSPYSYVPTNLNYQNDYADQVYIVSRNKLALNGTISSCGNASGTATVTLFENHVVGCHDAAAASDKNCADPNGQTSTVTGPGFVDVHRTMYVPGTATYVSKSVAATADCAAVRAAVP